MKLIACGERKKKSVLKEAIKEFKKIFDKVREEEVALKDALIERVEVNTALMEQQKVDRANAELDINGRPIGTDNTDT